MGMTEFPENKQKRLASLNQDVLAVSPARTSAADKSEPRMVQTGSHRVVTPDQNATVQPQSSKLLVVVSLLACAGVIIGVVGMLFALDSKQQLQKIQTQLTQPNAQVGSLSNRVAELEGRLDAAGQDTDKMGEQPQSSLLQTNSRIRKLAVDVSRLNAELEKLRTKLDSSGNSGAAAQELVKQQASRLKALESKVAGLSSSTGASAPAPVVAKAPLSDSQWEQQLVQLNIRMEKQASEIKAIYRMLESQ